VRLRASRHGEDERGQRRRSRPRISARDNYKALFFDVHIILDRGDALDAARHLDRLVHRRF